MQNPFLLASGVLNETGASMARAAREGVGAVVTKSMSKQPRPGHPNPTICEVDGGLLNAMGLPGPGLEHFAEEIAGAPESTLIGSVFGGTAEEFAEVTQIMAGLGVSGLELNVSCPHAKGYGSEIGSNPETLGEVVSAVKAAVSLPVWVKLTPNTDSVVRLGAAAVDAGADALVATNTLKALAINPELGRPVLGNRVGGLSGQALKPVALRAVWDLHAADLGVPIIASGGIYNARDVLEYAFAGAEAFQVGTAVMHRGWEVFGEISADLDTWLSSRDTTLGQLIGTGHK